MLIRKCDGGDFDAVYSIINDAAQAYQSICGVDAARFPRKKKTASCGSTGESPSGK